MHPVPWPLAWHAALYGPDGFYRRAGGPAAHFTTSTHGPLGEVLAEALGVLADAEGATRVLDLGAGRGELVAALHRHRPDLAVTGVDVVERPTALPAPVGWLRSPGGSALPSVLTDLEEVLVVAHEWLDVVPCPVAQVTGGRPLEVRVDPATGEESLTGPLDDASADWVARHWPTDGLPDGARVEVGLPRDRAWSDLLTRVRRGTVLAVDYGHTAADRPLRGTLAGYRDGVVVDPVPDGSCDVTAHVAVDSLVQDQRWSQREALHLLLGSATVPEHALATSDPAGYLTALARTSALRALGDPSGLGAFHWVLRRVGRAGRG